MIIDGRTIPSGTLVDVDLCIVGGGIAGISLALQYRDTPDVTVALVESGGRDWDARTQDLSDADAIGQAYFPLKETHLRVLGGSSLSYGGICTQLPPIQFEERSWVPDSGWPITKSDLDQYLPRAYELFEVDAPDTEAGPGSAPGTEWLEVAFSPPTRFGKRYASALDAAAKVTTYLHSTVTQIVPHPDGRHIEAVEVSTFDGNEYRIGARHFVLAGGGIEVPRLMLASNRVVSVGIGNEHDNVGRYFQEHVRVKDRYRLPERSEALATRVIGAAGTLRFSRLGVSEAAQREEELLDYYVNVAFGFACQDSPQWTALRRIVNARRSPWSDSPYYQDIGGGPNRIRREDIKAVLVRPDRSFLSLVGAGLRPAWLRRWLELDSSVEQAPHRDNRVVLSGEKDELGMPKAELHWRLDGNEERSYRRGLELVLEELDGLAPGIKHNRIDDPDPWPDEVIGTWHHVGTTRMHADPHRGVVDADAKVHGIDNLYIVG
ncbi:MAG: GMC oxidoreductase, partial [Candidatus Limnocylindrales bacterium]